MRSVTAGILTSDKLKHQLLVVTGQYGDSIFGRRIYKRKLFDDVTNYSREMQAPCMSDGVSLQSGVGAMLEKLNEDKQPSLRRALQWDCGDSD